MTPRRPEAIGTVLFFQAGKKEPSLFFLLFAAAAALGLYAPFGKSASASEVSSSPAEISREVNLGGLIQEALSRNPGIHAKRLEYEALKAKVIQAWLPEDPQVGVDVEGQTDAFHFSGRTNNEYMLMQTLPFPTKLFLRGLEASKEAQIAYQKYKEAQRDVIWHIEQPYYELYLAAKTGEILEANEKLLEQMQKSVKARYESGNGSQQDLIKVQIEISKNQVEIFDWKEKAHVAQAHFSHILNEPLDIPYKIPSSQTRPRLEVTRAEAEKTAMAKRPELQALRLGIERAKISRSLAANEWLPEITLRYEDRQYREQGRSDERDTFIGLSVPVWSLLKGMGGVWRSSDLDVKAAEAMVTQMKNEILLKVHESYSKAKASENAALVYENSILPQARQQAEVALAAYEAGRADIFNLIDSQKTLKDSQIEYLKSWAEYQMALSDLRLAVGDDLFKQGDSQ